MMSRRRRLPSVVLGVSSLAALLGAVLFSACGGDNNSSSANQATLSPSLAPVPVGGEVAVFAASSLTDAFKEAGATFQEQNPKAKVTFNFASSSTLATQINEGAPADVFASADLAQMKVVTDKSNASGPIVFATNLPVVVVPGTGSAVQSFADLAKPGIRLVLAGSEVPIGKYARDIFVNASNANGGVSAGFARKVLANLKSNEANVRAVLTKVHLGEADAGVVYGTDARIAANGVQVIEIPAQYNVIARYPMATVKGSKNAVGAAAWLRFILGADGQTILAKYGFGKPQ